MRITITVFTIVKRYTPKFTQFMDGFRAKKNLTTIFENIHCYNLAEIFKRQYYL